MVFDAPPIFKKFGDVLNDVNKSPAYHAGDTVSAVFAGANPRVRLAIFIFILEGGDVICGGFFI